MTEAERAMLSLIEDIHRVAKARPISKALRDLSRKAAEVEAMLRQEPYEAG